MLRPATLSVLLQASESGDQPVRDESNSAGMVEVSPPMELVSTGPWRVLFLLLPGILMKAATGFEPVLPSLSRTAVEANVSADVSYVDYVGDSVNPKAAAENILGVVSDMDYDLIVPIALSYSSNRVLDQIYVQARGVPLAKVPIMGDPPFGVSTLKPVRWLTKAVSLVPLALVKKFLIDAAPLPSPENIGNTADFPVVTGNPRVQTYGDYVAWVKESARRNLRDVEHSPGLYRSMVAETASYQGPSQEFVYLTRPVCIVCTSVEEVSTSWTVFKEDIDSQAPGPDGTIPVERPVNGTLVQPLAANRWVTAFDGNIDVFVVRSTHCGFYERPVAWDQAFQAAAMMAIVADSIL